MGDLASRAHDRAADAYRPVSLQRGAAPFAEGSCLVVMGDTRVLCSASVEEGVPRWRKGSGAGWVTAEYAMLPRATQQRTPRERNQLGGRTQEIQRLIGRSLRACVDLEAFGEWTIRVDCDVLQADGGTRTAAITGAAVALHDACRWLTDRLQLERSPFVRFVAAISAGAKAGQVLLDLDYAEDSRADVDLNVVGVGGDAFIEVQGTGERTLFSGAQLNSMLALASRAIDELLELQRTAVGEDA